MVAWWQQAHAALIGQSITREGNWTVFHWFLMLIRGSQVSLNRYCINGETNVRGDATEGRHIPEEVRRHEHSSPRFLSWSK